MKVVILGAGPAGLYCGLLMKKADPSHDITIIERNPPDATYGWGVVFSDRTLASFHEADYKTYKQITDHFVLWDAIDIRFRDEVIRCGGHIFAGLSRKLLLSILQDRCRELGVTLLYHTDVADPTTLASGADLIIAADGVNSLTRKAHEAAFGPTLSNGNAKYIWLGTDKPFDSFTFLFRENEHGFFQVHAYPFGGANSTFIVECDDATWRRAGLDTTTEAESIAYCERLFAGDLGRCRLLGNNSKWISFVTVKCRHWHTGNVVLLGDAAHTAHFSIGSGTKLAMEDAIALAHALDQYPDRETALNEYELERKPLVETLQAAARESQDYFERVSHTAHLAPVQFSFHLLTRSGRVTYDDLRLRDPHYGMAVDRWLATQNADTSSVYGSLVTPPPAFAPLHLRALTLPNRVVLESPPGLHGAEALAAGVASGAGLLLTEPVAVSADGRTTPEMPCLSHPGNATDWQAAVSALHAQSARVALMLHHAGRRGATQPRTAGLDRPLRTDAWPLVSASAIPYTPGSQTPVALDRAGMERVRDDFVKAAKTATAASVDLLLLSMGHGYLLASFLSPLANVRTDDYGGPLENRLHYPLEVFDAVRAVWPQDKPLAVALTVTDWAPGGLAIADGIAIACALKDHGCDLIQVLAGQTTSEYEPAYGRGFLTQLSDRVRNEARIPTLVGGYLTTTNEINTILAAGRADLCILTPVPLTSVGARQTADMATADKPAKDHAETRIHEKRQKRQDSSGRQTPVIADTST